MADNTQTESKQEGGKQGSQTEEGPASQQQTQTDSKQTGDGQQTGGAGSKEAVLADLARERDKRQALEQKLDTFTTGLAKALGLAEDGEPDPDKLQTQLTSVQSEARTLKVENSLYRVATAKGADPVALADSRTFMQAASELDPDADDFATKLGGMVDQALKEDPRFAATRSTGAGDAGARGDTQQETDMNALIRGARR